MTATDELRRLLDERDVKYQKLNEHVTWVFLEDRAITFFSDELGVSAEVSYPKPVLNGTKFLTPEQAIAATLVDDAYDAVANEHVITAEQLHALLDEWDKHPGRAATDGEMMTYATLGGGKLTAEQVRDAIRKHAHDDSCYIFEVYGEECDAIADELNAMLGSGECKVVASSTDGLTTDDPRQWFELSCGHAFKLDGLDAPVACPVCGKAVKR